MSEVWALDFYNMGAVGGPKIKADFVYSDLYQKHGKEMHEMERCGELVSAEFVPKQAYCIYSDVKAEIKTDIFILSGRLGFSQKVYEVIKDFDYGGGGLTPFEVFEFDRATKAKKVTDNYYTLNFAGNKQAILPEKSSGLRYFEPLDHYNLPMDKNGVLTVDGSALEGPDVWVDPKITGAIFLSSRFVHAIKSIKPKAKGRFPLFKCKVL